MPHIVRSALVPYSAAQMYRLVNEVEHYPKFLPWCQSAQVIDRTENSQKAKVVLAKGAIRQSFTTANRMQPDASIDLSLVEGPFRTLKGTWQFQNLGDSGCKVSFDVRFEFRNRLLSLTVGPVFDHICKTLVDAFIARAHQQYK